MAIRLTGMISGLDTESLIKGMVDAQRLRNKKTTDKSALLDFKKEKWKELNTKLYKLYQEDLSKLRFPSNYNSKKASSSNDQLVGVSASNGAAKGSHIISVEKLASAQIQTGDEIKDGNPINITSSTKLKDLGVDIDTVFNISHKNETITLEVTEDTKVSDFIDKLKSAGLNANFDINHKRFFISSKESGVDNSFEITASKIDPDSYKNDMMEKLGYDSLSSEDKELVDEALDILSFKDGQEEDINTAVQTLETIAEQKRNQVASDAEALEKSLIKEEVEREELELFKERKRAEGVFTEAEIDAFVVSDIDDIDDLEQKIEDAIEAGQERIDTAKASAVEQAGLGTDAIKKTVERYRNAGMLEPGEQLQKLGLANQKNIKKASDAAYTYNGVPLTSPSNEVTVNGLTLSLKGKTTGGVNISVHDNTQANYDMVKKFITNYNAVLKEMNDLFYAPSSKGYNPLSDEEKEVMTEKQIERWEDKIKDSILRRDSTLGSVLNAMKSAVMSVVEVDGKSYSLSSFGIGSSTDYTEKGLLHINGDADDSLVSDLENKLMKALEENPEIVTKVLSGITSNLYKAMDERMTSIPNVRSKFSFYNDKTMEKQQQDHGKKIKELEKRLVELENKYYKQFAAMEKAMSQMQSQSNALAGLLGQSSN